MCLTMSIRASVHREREKPPAALWLAWFPPQDYPDRVDQSLQKPSGVRMIARWPIEPGLHFRKETFGWTMPRFQSKETGRSLDLAHGLGHLDDFSGTEPLSKMRPLPWQKAQQRLTPQRVQQSIRPIFALIGTPARPPKQRGIPPGWPSGKPRSPKTRLSGGQKDPCRV